jgi:hypothetical protein
MDISLKWVSVLGSLLGSAKTRSLFGPEAPTCQVCGELAFESSWRPRGRRWVALCRFCARDARLATGGTSEAKPTEDELDLRRWTSISRGL